jgi:hypothetical protein
LSGYSMGRPLLLSLPFLKEVPLGAPFQWPRFCISFLTNSYNFWRGCMVASSFSNPGYFSGVDIICILTCVNVQKKRVFKLSSFSRSYFCQSISVVFVRPKRAFPTNYSDGRRILTLRLRGCVSLGIVFVRCASLPAPN